MTSQRVKGHVLRHEGQVWRIGNHSHAYLSHHERTGTGPARCSCGEESPNLLTTAARKRWHRQHKAEVFVCESCGQPAGVTLKDGSFWCRSCDGSARRLGYAS